MERQVLIIFSAQAENIKLLSRLRWQNSGDQGKAFELLLLNYSYLLLIFFFLTYHELVADTYSVAFPIIWAI